MSVVIALHERVFNRRIRVLSELIAALLPERASVLDIGCGDGTLASRILRLRPDVTIQGIDVLARPGTAIPVEAFDGRTIPHADGSFDTTVMIDVLHHAADPRTLLREARRVARRSVVIKDHLADRVGAEPMLRLMDWVGNARYGVRLPYTYWRHAEWTGMLADSGLRVERWTDDVPLYPFPVSVPFGWGLHFVASLAPTS